MIETKKELIPGTWEAMAGLTWSEASALKNESVWQAMADTTLGDAIDAWVAALKPLTRRSYASAMRTLATHGIIDPLMSLKAFALQNTQNLLDAIKAIPGLAEASKQARCAAVIGLTSFLSRKSGGMIKKIEAVREGSAKTFFPVRSKVKAEALSQNEWRDLISAMKEASERDAAIASFTLAGARRIDESLSVLIENYDPAARTVKVVPSKSRGTYQEITVSLSQEMSDAFLKLKGDRTEGFLFITRNGEKLDRKQFERSLKRAAKKAGLEKNVHAHQLRATSITEFRRRGVQDFEIQRLTGHASAEMLNKYDKESNSENASKRVFLA